MEFTKDQLKVIGSNIRAERARRGWSRDDAAEATGIPGPTIVSYENGAACPSIGNVWKLADAFGMSMGELVGRDESAYAKAS